jgi:hypothetical protein
MESIMAREEKLIENLSPLITEKKSETTKTLSFHADARPRCA